MKNLNQQILNFHYEQNFFVKTENSVFLFCMFDIAFSLIGTFEGTL